ncbi:GNAT family N-acetyltransferase [Nonomuraea sp. NPDC050663]|uniref:GNAT family N-acetyltransferase n=1 Tax=Nonomuraea sp. NPDC050663 TaxID=3364370 RepID=UPI0037AC5A1B
MLSLFDRQMRRDARPDAPDAKVEHVDGVVRQVSAGGWNGILWSGLSHDTADAAIAAQVAFYGDLGYEFEWKHYAHDQPADLPERLLAAGFTADEPETLMLARIDDLALDGPVPDGIELRRVTSPADVDLMMRVHTAAFGTSAEHIRTRLLAQLDSVVAVVAMAGDEPVSAARLELHEGTDFASLWSGGTLPEWRGRGLYRSLVAHRAGIATERGFRYLQVDASDQSRPILERLGFTPVTTTTPYTR